MWEIAIIRLATMVEVGARPGMVQAAVSAERAAYRYWSEVMERSIKESEIKGDIS